MQNLSYLSILAVMIFILSGCATIMSYEEIVQAANDVGVSNGIDQSEAKVLAQKFLIENQLDASHSVYRVGKITSHGDHWDVSFNAGVARGSTSAVGQWGFVGPLHLRVNKETGEVEVGRSGE